jgi:hypothetical protein
LFLAASSISSRRPGGRLSVRTINDVCDRVGGWHDGELPDPDRQLGGLHPHDYADLRVMPTSGLKAA